MGAEWKKEGDRVRGRMPVSCPCKIFKYCKCGGSGPRGETVYNRGRWHLAESLGREMVWVMLQDWWITEMAVCMCG